METMGQTPRNENIATLLGDGFKQETNGLDQTEVVRYLAEKVESIARDGVKVISLVGGAGAGKSTLADALVKELRGRSVASDRISTDGFVVGTREERRELEKKDPLAKYDFDYMNSIVRRVRAGEDDVPTPTYNEVTGLAIAQGVENYVHHIGRVQCLIVEGDFDKVENPNMRIYLHVPDETRLRNRIGRDLAQRGESDHQKIAENFQYRQAQQYIPYTLPALANADIVLDVSVGESGYVFDAYCAEH